MFQSYFLFLDIHISTNCINEKNVNYSDIPTICCTYNIYAYYTRTQCVVNRFRWPHRCVSFKYRFQMAISLHQPQLRHFDGNAGTRVPSRDLSIRAECDRTSCQLRTTRQDNYPRADLDIRSREGVLRKGDVENRKADVGCTRVLVT